MVHFAEPWPPNERALVRNAIVAFEASTQLPSPPLGAPWIVTTHTFTHMEVYFAQRSGLDHGVQARSAEGLANAIRARAETLNNRSPS